LTIYSIFFNQGLVVKKTHHLDVQELIKDLQPRLRNVDVEDIRSAHAMSGWSAAILTWKNPRIYPPEKEETKGLVTTLF